MDYLLDSKQQNDSQRYNYGSHLDRLIASDTQSSKGWVVAMLIAFCINPHNNITTGYFCPTRVLGSLVPTFTGAAVTYRFPRFGVLPP